MSEFAFDVGWRCYQKEGTSDPENRFYVELPHQCDEWLVTSSASRREAEQELLAFIKEAGEALEGLRTVTPCEHDWHATKETTVHNGGLARLWKCSKCQSSWWPVEDSSLAKDWYKKAYPDGESLLAKDLVGRGEDVP